MGYSAELLRSSYRYTADTDGVFVLHPHDEWPYEKYASRKVREVLTNKHDEQYTIWMYRNHLHSSNLQRKFKLSRESYKLMSDTLNWKSKEPPESIKAEKSQGTSKVRKSISIVQGHEIKRKIIQGKVISI